MLWLATFGAFILGSSPGNATPTPGFIALPASIPVHETAARSSPGVTAARDSSPHKFFDADTLVFAPTPGDSLTGDITEDSSKEPDYTDHWLRAPFGDQLITDVDQWRSREGPLQDLRLHPDYNRVDRLRLGVSYQIQSDDVMYPRLGARLEYAFGRERLLYGVQVEQPLLPPGRLALGISMVRRTDHPELQQVDDVENSLALLFGRQDYRDYFEREGYGAYLAWRVPDFSTVSVLVRNDEFRSLPLDSGTGSFFHKNRSLRGNPPVDDGESHAVTLRLERLAHRTRHTRAGFYHWVDLERSGHGLGGDFEYTRLLADLRSVIRLTPATTLSVRAVGGHTPEGILPAQKRFTLGGVDGLRAHTFSQYVGNQMVLGQAEYIIGLWRVRSGLFEGGLHAIAFADLGRAWTNGDNQWDPSSQQIQADGGFGLATSEDNVRVYFAKNLQEPDSDFVVSLRLQRPF